MAALTNAVRREFCSSALLMQGAQGVVTPLDSRTLSSPSSHPDDLLRGLRSLEGLVARMFELKSKVLMC